MSNQTGPRAEEGKKASSQNNRRHGLSTANVIVSPAERPLFDQLEAELRDEIDVEDLADPPPCHRHLANGKLPAKRSHPRPEPGV